jgi:hypothetical protein
MGPGGRGLGTRFSFRLSEIRPIHFYFISIRSSSTPFLYALALAVTFPSSGPPSADDCGTRVPP